MPRYVSIFVSCNKSEVKVHGVAPTLEEMMVKLESRYGDITKLKLEPEDKGFPGYLTGDLNVVGRYGAKLEDKSSKRVKEYIKKWEEDFGDKGYNCCNKRIIIVKASSKMSLNDIVKQIHVV
jgi:hypothetical protein